jgi:hypothetical protein
MLVAASPTARPTTDRSVTRAVSTTNAGNAELDNNARLEKRTLVPRTEVVAVHAARSPDRYQIWRYHYDTIGALALLGFRPPAFEAFAPDFPA